MKAYTPAPSYCEADRQAKTEGHVILQATIDAAGCVVSAHVLKGLTPCLDRASLSAVQGWVFEPATLQGKPVRVYYTLTVNFEVEKGPAAPDPPL